jgi:electron transport complex protein RnfG
MSEELEHESAETEDASEPSSTRLITTLSLAGLFSGLILVGVYELTLPRIEANQARELREAVFKVLPGTERFQPMGFIDGTLAEAGEDEENVVYAGYDQNDELLGYAIPGEGAGFQDTIKLIYGFKPAERIIVGMEVLESRETPGLGDKIYKDAAFRENFLELSVDPEIVPVAEKTAPNEIDTITGATISSKAVANILNTTNGQWLPRLDSSKPKDQEEEN